MKEHRTHFNEYDVPFVDNDIIWHSQCFMAVFTLLLVYQLMVRKRRHDYLKKQPIDLTVLFMINNDDELKFIPLNTLNFTISILILILTSENVNRLAESWG